MKINYKKLAIYILIPLIFGTIIGLLTSSFSEYKNIIMPKFAPPGWVFPVVWSILYILMGISRYIVEINGNDTDAVKVYNFQLFINLTWTFFFFTFKWYLFSFIWILLLLSMVSLMTYKFYKISKASGFLQIPYIIWIVFAAILNYATYMLN